MSHHLIFSFEGLKKIPHGTLNSKKRIVCVEVNFFSILLEIITNIYSLLPSCSMAWHSMTLDATQSLPNK